MTKKIIEYKFHRADIGGMKTPDFIGDGGYFQNPSDNSLIGLVDNGREYWIPDTNNTDVYRIEIVSGVIQATKI